MALADVAAFIEAEPGKRPGELDLLPEARAHNRADAGNQLPYSNDCTENCWRH
jgi:hypothetical protein